MFRGVRYPAEQEKIFKLLGPLSMEYIGIRKYVSYIQLIYRKCPFKKNDKLSNQLLMLPNFPRGIVPCGTISCRVSYPAEQYSAGYCTPWNILPRGTIPRGILFRGVRYPAEIFAFSSETVQWCIVNFGTLFCGVSYPVEQCSAGYRTPVSYTHLTLPTILLV